MTKRKTEANVASRNQVFESAEVSGPSRPWFSAAGRSHLGATRAMRATMKRCEMLCENRSPGAPCGRSNQHRASGAREVMEHTMQQHPGARGTTLVPLSTMHLHPPQ